MGFWNSARWGEGTWGGSQEGRFSGSAPQGGGPSQSTRADQQGRVKRGARRRRRRRARPGVLR